MNDEQQRHRFARLSLITLALTLAFTSIRHVYRFGPAALMFNAVTVVLVLLLLWYRSRRRAPAVWIYALLGSWVITGFGLVDGLWDGALKLYARYFFPNIGIFTRSAPQPFGFEAAAILTSVTSVFAIYYGFRFLGAVSAGSRRPLLLIVPLLVVVAGSAYGISRRSRMTGNDDVVRIGVIVPTRGPASPLGRAFLRGVELAKAERPTRRRYELVIADSGTSPKETRAAIERLVYEKNVNAIVGGISLSGRIVKPYATAERIPHLCVCSVQTIGDGVFNFTNIPLPEDEAQRWMEEAQRRGIRRIAILAQKYPSIDGHIKALTKEVAGSDARIVYVNRFEASTTDFRAMIDEARHSDPDVYMIEGFNPALDLLGEQLTDAGIHDIASIVALAISQRQDLFEGAWYTDSAVDDDLRARFEAKYPDTPFVAHMIPYAYDSLNILLDGFESRQGIGGYVRSVTRHTGAAGTIVRAPGGGNFRSRPAVWVITNGKAHIARS